MDGYDEAVAALGERLDEPWILRRVAESLSKTVHRRIQPMVEVDERVGRPQLLPKLLTGDDIPATGQQQDQNVERPATQFDLATLFPQLTSPAVNLEEAKPIGRPRRFG